jgi:hypothetical protein
VLFAFALSGFSEMPRMEGVNAAGEFDAVVSEHLAAGEGQEDRIAENLANLFGAGVRFTQIIRFLVLGTLIWRVVFRLLTICRTECRKRMF